MYSGESRDKQKKKRTLDSKGRKRREEVEEEQTGESILRPASGAGGRTFARTTGAARYRELTILIGERGLGRRCQPALREMTSPGRRADFCAKLLSRARWRSENRRTGRVGRGLASMGSTWACGAYDERVSARLGVGISGAA